MNLTDNLAEILFIPEVGGGDSSRLPPPLVAELLVVGAAKVRVELLHVQHACEPALEPLHSVLLLFESGRVAPIRGLSLAAESCRFPLGGNTRVEAAAEEEEEGEPRYEHIQFIPAMSFPRCASGFVEFSTVGTADVPLCGAAASCVDSALSFGSLESLREAEVRGFAWTMPLCTCNGSTYPNPLAPNLQLAPYAEYGCSTPPSISSLTYTSDVVELELSKTGTSVAVEERDINTVVESTDWSAPAHLCYWLCWLR